MPSYDGTRFSPPAPVALIRLRNLDKTATVEDVPMLLDTGADVTMLPAQAVGTLSDVPTSEKKTYGLLSFDGRTSQSPAVRLELVLLGRSFRGQFLLIEQELGILGRNILNLLPLFYDGPRLTGTVGTSPT